MCRRCEVYFSYALVPCIPTVQSVLSFSCFLYCVCVLLKVIRPALRLALVSDQRNEMALGTTPPHPFLVKIRVDFSGAVFHAMPTSLLCIFARQLT